jgi:hypothetical protein
LRRRELWKDEVERMDDAVSKKIEDSLKSGGAELISTKVLQDIQKDFPSYQGFLCSRQGRLLPGVKKCIQVEWKKRGLQFTTLVREDLSVILAINMDVDEKSHTLASLAAYTLGKVKQPGQKGIVADSFNDAEHYLMAGEEDVSCLGMLYRDLNDFREEGYRRSGG